MDAENAVNSPAQWAEGRFLCEVDLHQCTVGADQRKVALARMLKGSNYATTEQVQEI